MNLIEKALKNEMKFTSGITGKEISDSATLIIILNMLAELDAFYNRVEQMSK
jgi:hypothetical protein